MNQITGARTSAGFTDKQGQYLAFIAAYTLVNGRPPAEIDMQRFFGTTPPTVHQMVVTLEKAGLIRRTPRAPRSIVVITDPDTIPKLRPGQNQLVKSTVQGY